MQYKMRNDQSNQLDGDRARMDIGREDLKVFLKGSEEEPAITKKSVKGFGYATDLRSRTQGRATYSMHFDRYEPAPSNVSEEVVARMQGK